MGAKPGNLVMRIATAAVVLPLTLVLLWRPELRWAWVSFVTLIVCMGLVEYYRLARASGTVPQVAGGVAAGAGVALAAGIGTFTDAAAAFCAGCLLVMALQTVRGQLSVANVAVSLFGILYVGWFGAHILLLHNIADVGRGLVVTLLVAVVLTDVGAYCAGKLLGKHKLAPVLSPNKTWEGAAGGFAAAIAGAYVLYRVRAGETLDMFPDWPLWRYVVTGAALSATAQLGDLVESSLKRDARVKDAGGAFPGHGGVLDRCDGFLFAGPVLYYMAGF